MGLIQFLWKNYLRIKNPSCKLHGAGFSRNVTFEHNVTVEHGSFIQADSIGKYTYINKYCLIDKNSVSIGRFCSIAYSVKIGLGTHPVDWVSSHSFAYDKKYGFQSNNKSFQNQSSRSCVIGNDVWIGANSIILAGVHVGDGAIIGANSLVTKDVEPYSIVFGNPANFHRFRFSNEIRKKMLKIKWWNWSDEKIKKNIIYFNNPQLFCEKFF